MQGSSRNRKTHTIKSFLRYLHAHGIIPDNVAGRLVAPRVTKPEPRYLSEEEYRRLLRGCSHHIRDAAIIELFLQTGMRRAELARLTVSDVELPRRIAREPENMGTVRVHRKGGKRESIPINYKVCQALAA